MKKCTNIFRLFLLLALNTSSNGQVKTNTPKNPNTSKPSPEVIGTPSSSSLYRPPYNDTTLVSQYIRSIFQDSNGNFWFAPAGQSTTRFDPSVPILSSNAFTVFTIEDGINCCVQSMYQTGQEICGGVPGKDSLDLTANAFIRLNRMAPGNKAKGDDLIVLKNKHAVNSMIGQHRLCLSGAEGIT